MSVALRLLRLLASILALLLTLGGCASVPSNPAGQAMAFYLDANLGVALEHPLGWQRQKRTVDPDPDARLSVRWAPRRLWGRAPELGMTLTSLPPQRAVGGFPTLLQRYLQRHPEVVSDLQVEIPVAGLPGLRLEGSTTQRRLLVYFVTSAQRAVILEFSAPPPSFEANRPLFEAIAASLIILSPQSARPADALPSE